MASTEKRSARVFPSIIYEDNDLLVVDKPAGLLVIPSPKGESVTLGTLVNDMIAAQGFHREGEAPEGGHGGLAHPCHRIDRETSGVMVYARGKAMQQKVMDLFHTRVVHKTYLALVNGVVGKLQGTARMPIEGKEAVTNWKVLGGTDKFSLVMVMPITGRTNQIRIHFAQMGHPLLGDAKFGVRKNFTQPFKRTALHAWRLELHHPVSGLPLAFEAPVPADMAALIKLTGAVLPGK